MSDKIQNMLNDKGWLLGDGATGTNLFKQGLETGYPPELWNEEQPDKIAALHQSFIAAGSDILLTNSFGGNALRLKLHQAEKKVTALNKAAADIAREQADKADKAVAVAGSVGPTGELFEPMGALTSALAEEVFEEQAQALAAGGADMLQIETMSSVEEVEAAVTACRKTGLPVMATMSFDTAGRSMMGITPEQYAQQAVIWGLDGFGANCGIGPAELLHSVIHFQHEAQTPLIVAKGNCGIPHYLDGEIHYHGTPELMADYALFARDAGASIIGGCCGTTPEHIQAMADALDASPPSTPLDAEAMLAKLGEPWKDLPQNPAENTRRKRSRRRK